MVGCATPHLSSSPCADASWHGIVGSCPLSFAAVSQTTVLGLGSEMFNQERERVEEEIAQLRNSIGVRCRCSACCGTACRRLPSRRLVPEPSIPRSLFRVMHAVVAGSAMVVVFLRRATRCGGRWRGFGKGHVAPAHCRSIPVLGAAPVCDSLSHVFLPYFLCDSPVASRGNDRISACVAVVAV